MFTKRFLPILAAIMLLPLTVHAQKIAGDFEIGLGVAYGFDIAADGEMGMNANLYYSVTDEIRLGVDFIYYLLNDPQFQDPRFYELNLNANYHFVNQEVLRMYLLLGLHYASFSYETPVITAEASTISDSEIGLNAGGGIELNFDSIILFAEPKLTVNGFDQLSVTVGGRFFF